MKLSPYQISNESPQPRDYNQQKERLEKIQILGEFERKITDPALRERMHKTFTDIGSHKETNWLTVRSEALTGASLQAMISYDHISKHRSRSARHSDYPRDPSTEYRIFTRLSEKVEGKDVSPKASLVAGFRVNNLGNKSIYINSELGLSSGIIDFSGNSDIDPLTVAQALDIERELLDPIIAGQDDKSLDSTEFAWILSSSSRL